MAGCDPGLKARTEANPDRLSPFQGQASFSSSLFQRRIEFHPARKQHDGFAARSGDFKIETLNPSGGSSSDQSNKLGQHSNPGRTLGKKVDGFELLENWLDPELSLGVSVQRIGAGLQNLGNTCFLNSVLQCLTYTEPLAAYLQSGRHQNSCRINGFCALCAIQKHISRALNSTGRILAPKDLVLNLRCISRNFRNARQEDAHEYMVNLLESMHKCCLPSGVPSESPSAYEKSLVHKIFGGRLRSQVKCTQCSYCSDTFDPFLDLSLEIAKADSLVKALKHFTASEQLDGGERQYQCQRCKQKVRALKQLTVHKAPYVLTIHLKRFHSHDPGRKIDKRVQFDPTIDLKPFVSGSYEGDLKYTLYGVLVHRGWSTHSGHYFCYVRTSTNMWYSLDDNQVCQVSESTVLQQNAYMLFYVRNRSHIQPRKVIGTPHKEGIKENAGATGATLISNQIPRAPVKTDHIKNSTSVVVSAATFISRDTLSVGSSSKITMKEPPVQTTLGREGAESPLMKNNPVVESVSRSSLSKGSVNECPLSTQNLAAGIAVGVGSYDKLENRTSERELMASVSQFPASIASKNPAAEKSKKEETTKQVNAVPRMGVPVIDSSNNSSDKYFEKVGTVTSPNKAVYNTSQGITGESISGPLACEKTDKIEEQLRSYEDVKFPAAEVISNGFSHSKALDCKTHKKFKKHLRYQFVGLRMGSNIFLQGSLRPCKKHKKMKNCRLVSKGLDKQLNKDHFASDLGPSTSETVKPLPPLSKRKGSKSSSKRRVDGISSRSAMTSNGDLTMSAMSGGFRERKTQAAAVLATDQLSEKSISSEAAANLGGKSRDIENLKDSKADTMQNGLMSMLTRGLEETLVAHWDGIEFSPPPTTESNGSQNGTLGYVLDEWDEEYDRGKRKKVRQSRLDFGGPNYFQEFASQKIKLKKAKLESARSGNLPFRI